MEGKGADLKCENQVLSDVHVNQTSRTICISDGSFYESKFSFKRPLSLRCMKENDSVVSSEMSDAEPTSTVNQPHSGTGADHTHSMYNYDEDGDIIVKRKPAEKNCEELVITIVHAMATDLNDVGQQVWLGALLLCDFILHYSTLFDGRVIIDLGAGVGLTSIVAAFPADTVYCTDRGDDILSLAVLNAECNGCLHQNSNIHVREIDWTAAAPFTTDLNTSGEKNPFTLSDEDMQSLESCSIVLAAEVVYDDDLTDAFFCMLYNLLLKPPAKTVYMTVEKRQVFTVTDKDIVSPAYEHFRENLQDLCSIDEGPVRFLCSQIDSSFPQYSQYERTKELELWKIETVFMHQPQLSQNS